MSITEELREVNAEIAALERTMSGPYGDVGQDEMQDALRWYRNRRQQLMREAR